MEGRGRTDTVAVCVEHADLLPIYHLEELLDLLVLGRLIVILPCDGGVRLGVDVALLEITRHLEYVCSRKGPGGDSLDRCDAGDELRSW
jgi:hypothetical protein